VRIPGVRKYLKDLKDWKLGELAMARGFAQLKYDRLGEVIEVWLPSHRLRTS
jgi:hypothetical protein